MIETIYIADWFKALQKAMEVSLECDFPIYFIRINSGVYAIDSQPEIFSDEKLVMTIFKGEAQ